MGTSYIIDGTGSSQQGARVNTDSALHVFLDGGSLTYGGGGTTTGSRSLHDLSGVHLYFDNNRVPISGVSLPAITGSVAVTTTNLSVAGSMAITSSVAFTQTGSVAITSSIVLPISGTTLGGSFAISSYNNWTGIGSVFLGSQPPIPFIGSVAVTSSSALTIAGSVAITSSAGLAVSGQALHVGGSGTNAAFVYHPLATGSATAGTPAVLFSTFTNTAINTFEQNTISANVINSALAVSGARVDMVLVTGSYVALNLVSGTWNFRLGTSVQTHSWAISISGGATQFDVTTMSGTTMVYHTIPSTVPLFAEDTRPTWFAVRTAVNISGTLEIWSP